MTSDVPTARGVGVTSTTAADQTKRTVTWIARAVAYLAYFYFIVVEIILAIGFFLLLFGANPSTPFVEWVYRSVDRAMRPFRGIFEPIELGTTGNEVEAVFDTSVLFAMVIYGIVVLVIHAVISWLSGRIERIDAENRTRRLEAAYAPSTAGMSGPSGATAPASPAAPGAGPPPPTTPGAT
jgi:hypothetical protein